MTHRPSPSEDIETEESNGDSNRDEQRYCSKGQPRKLANAFKLNNDKKTKFTTESAPYQLFDVEQKLAKN